MGPVCLEALQRHASPEPVILAANSIKLGSSRFLDKGTEFLADDAEQPLSKYSIGLRITHFSGPEP